MSEETVELHQPMSPNSPGALLKQARLAKQMTEVEVARQLHLRAQVIAELEADDYSNFAALIYLRGYLRAYAKLLGLEEQQVLALFDAGDMTISQSQELGRSRPLPIYTQSSRVRHHLLRWVGLGLLLLTVTLVALWWHGQQQRSDTSPRLPSKQQTVPLSADNTGLQSNLATQAASAQPQSVVEHNWQGT